MALHSLLTLFQLYTIILAALPFTQAFPVAPTLHPLRSTSALHSHLPAPRWFFCETSLRRLATSICFERFQPTLPHIQPCAIRDLSHPLTVSQTQLDTNTSTIAYESMACQGDSVIALLGTANPQDPVITGVAGGAASASAYFSTIVTGHDPLTGEDIAMTCPRAVREPEDCSSAFQAPVYTDRRARTRNVRAAGGRAGWAEFQVGQGSLVSATRKDDGCFLTRVTPLPT